MTLAKRLLEWCERYYVKDGTAFTTEGREWVWDNVFQPVFGWKLWPNDPDELCDACKERVGEWCEWSPQLIRKLRAHAHRKKGCKGLRLHPNTLTILNLQRGAGKSTNLFALLCAALDAPELAPFSARFMAAAGEQADALVAANMVRPIEQDRGLSRRFRATGGKVVVEHKGLGVSMVEVMDTSKRSTRGGRSDLLLVDEGAYVDNESFTALLPSIKGKSKLVCPHSHVEQPYTEDHFPKCSACGEHLVPRIPRVMVVSTSGADDGENAYSWFNELVDFVQQNALPNAHIFRSANAANPNISEHENSVIDNIFGQLPSLRRLIEVEQSNQALRKGDAFVTRADLRRVADRSVQNLPGSLLECVGFLDTSWSSDLTSLLICGWDPELCDRAWSQLRVLHWKIWAPKELSGGVIDPTQIQAHLDHHIPLFPSLRLLMVDDRGMEWAKRLVIYNNRERARSWGRKVKAFHGKRVRTANGRTRSEGERVPGLFGGQDDRDRGWQLLEQRIAMGPGSLAIPTEERLPEMHKELLGVIRKMTSDGGYQITDRNRKKRHADVADGLAGCCLLAYLEQTATRRSFVEAIETAQDEEMDRRLRPVVQAIQPETFGW